MDIRQQFGCIIRDIRTGKGLAREELAFRAGMSVPYLSNIERGRSSPSLSLMADLARALEVPLVELVKDILLDDAVTKATDRKRPKDE
ncbi:helix-turn-helix domain-containing protein [Oleisolibacter albus]|uniref:helix-turn-helix domain-containing protein n=1 Tax=Oleisolibacter albus TaxID=2171757 RepID=UPI0013906C91|nr:helix-turn-helix transcriptional regulator [Oleisolibacter albus]